MIAADCPECGTRNAAVLPSRGDCQTCLKARMDFLDMTEPTEPEEHAPDRPAYYP